MELLSNPSGPYVFKNIYECTIKQHCLKFENWYEELSKLVFKHPKMRNMTQILFKKTIQPDTFFFFFGGTTIFIVGNK